MNYQERLNKFIALCELEKTTDEICEELNITRRTLNEYEKKLGIKCRKLNRVPDFKKFRELCELEKTTDEICKEMNISRRTLNEYEKKLGIKCVKKIRNPNLNKDFFKLIDDEYKAYILGFIYADGYIESNERALTFNINKKDVDILYKIKECMNCSNQINKSSTKNCIRLYLSSIELVNDLKKLGITRNKTKKISLPKIDKKLLRHFFRGYFDGDGHIGKRQCVLVIGSKLMFEDFIDFFKLEFEKNLSYKKMGNYYRIVFNRSDYKFIHWLYKNSHIFLDRKYKSFEDNWLNYKPKG